MLKLKVSKMCTLILCGLIFLLVTQPIFKSVRFYSVCLTVHACASSMHRSLKRAQDLLKLESRVRVICPVDTGDWSGPLPAGSGIISS